MNFWYREPWYYLGALKKIPEDKNGENGENLLHLEITEVVPINCNIVNKDYQCNSRKLFTLVPDKSSGHLLDILPKNIFHIEIWFSDQNSKLLVTKDLKRVIQETAEVTEDFIGDKILKVPKISTQNTLDTVPSETESIVFDDKIPKERFISTEKREHIMKELRLI